MEIKRAGSQPSAKGPSEWFTGVVRIDPLFQTPDPALVSGASVTFEPAARTAWHTHPLGQTLIVTSGVGRVQCWGRPIEEIRPGDVVWIPHCAALARNRTLVGAASRYRLCPGFRRLAEDRLPAIRRRYGPVARIILAVSSPLASAASTVPMSGPA